MKLAHILTGLALSLVLSGNSVSAQNAPADNQKSKKEMKKGECPMMGNEGMQMGRHEEIPNLTDEQKTKIKELRLANYKETLPLKNQLNELKAKQQTLITADKADLKAINANIDEMTKVQNQLMKAKAAHQQQIRGMLTDEQRMYFDTHSKKMGKGKMGDGPKGMGKERGMKSRCDGMGPQGEGGPQGMPQQPEEPEGK